MMVFFRRGAWWKKNSSVNDNSHRHHLELSQQHFTASSNQGNSIPGNATSNITTSQNSNAVTNNTYMVPAIYKSLKEKEAQFNEASPSYNTNYENVNDQKSN